MDWEHYYTRLGYLSIQSFVYYHLFKKTQAGRCIDFIKEDLHM